MKIEMNHIKYLRRELEEYRALSKCMELGGGWRSKAMQLRISRLTEELADQLWEISKLIAEIEDAELRLIFELRYYRGLSWAEVASALPTKLSPDAARMKHQRYLKKIAPSKMRDQSFCRPAKAHNADDRSRRIPAASNGQQCRLFPRRQPPGLR